MNILLPSKYGTYPKTWSKRLIFILLVGVFTHCDVAEDQIPTSLSLGDPVEVEGRLAREPMVQQHPNGDLFLSGYSIPSPFMYRSSDHGRTWTEIDLNLPEDGPVGNSDIDIKIGADGTVYLLQMYFDLEVFEGKLVNIGVGRNNGTDWTWSSISMERFDDRPWLEIDPEGTLHVIWNDGAGVKYARSNDGGITWVRQPLIYPSGGSSHFTSGPNGELIARISPFSASGWVLEENGPDFMALSLDRGNTWKIKEVPGLRVWNQVFGAFDGLIPRWVEPMAFDAAGDLYYFWSEGTTMHLARSTDLGDTWQSWQVFEGAELAYYQWMIGGAEGELGVSWFTGVNETLKVHAGLIELKEDETGELVPLLTEVTPFDIRAETRPDVDGNIYKETAGEYIPLIFLENGEMGAVTPIQERDPQVFGFVWHPIERSPK
ncbi:MAG TPA: hypothetical protein DCE41_27160 [Cytophagales bacterium]|nr:hypothetical protein [Cytophagales bacterium]HAA19991.1 hypothetical protein [Cytophagales bacterium]HAP63641.1 hypothetical protein [Cytophagales bacterium]